MDGSRARTVGQVQKLTRAQHPGYLAMDYCRVGPHPQGDLPPPPEYYRSRGLDLPDLSYHCSCGLDSSSNLSSPGMLLVMWYSPLEVEEGGRKIAS